MTIEKRRKLFDAEKVGVFLDGISHRKVTTQDGEAPMVDLDLRIEPLTPELASEIDPEVRRSLFELSTGEARSLVSSVSFSKLAIPQQNVHVYTTPDTETARIMFDRCDVSRILARMVKGYDGFGLRFRLSFSHPTKDQHAYLAEHLYSQFFITTEQTDPDLFETREPVHAPRPTRAEAEQPRLVEGVDEGEEAEPGEEGEEGDEADQDAEPTVDAGERLPVTRQRDPRKAKRGAKKAGAKKATAKKGRGRRK